MSESKLPARAHFCLHAQLTVNQPVEIRLALRHNSMELLEKLSGKALVSDFDLI